MRAVGSFLFLILCSAPAAQAARGPSGSKPDAYTVLGISRRANEAQIKEAFRTLMRQHHPDVSREPGAEERSQEITAAYHELTKRSAPELEVDQASLEVNRTKLKQFLNEHRPQLYHARKVALHEFTKLFYTPELALVFYNVYARAGVPFTSANQEHLNDEVLRSYKEWLEHIWSLNWPHHQEQFPMRSMMEFDFLSRPAYGNPLGLGVGRTILTHLRFVHDARRRFRKSNPRWVAQLRVDTNRYVEEMLSWLRSLNPKDGGLNTTLLALTLAPHPVLMNEMTEMNRVHLEEMMEASNTPAKRQERDEIFARARGEAQANQPAQRGFVDRCMSFLKRSSRD